MAAPEFVAGFVYGMTGDNNLEEIETCMQGGEDLFNDIQTAFYDLTEGNFIAALTEIGGIVAEFQTDLTNCENMDQDIYAIEQWAQIFTEPVELAETLAKNMLFHSSEIYADIATCEADWMNGDYFGSGTALADALTVAVGPIEKFYLMGGGKNGLDLNSILAVMEGLNYRLLMVNELLDLKECVDLTADTALIFYQAYEDVIAGDTMGGFMKAAEGIAEMYVDIKYCKSAIDDDEITDFIKWL